ncbi:putative acetyltransferase [Candidatus Izimaplasma bacterium HR1]|uniref:GNAT family N-acetyltransferase n=1 Tax=Candidatus Izimoplasma sp. HR1 TaxID=1541959 RepID=UPI0004F81E63|nr:putative acetyltransferase [Candidatus Izimaplasma bacterium HR1]
MIKYIYEENLKNRPELSKHLVEYNTVFTGVRPTEDRYFYIKENGRLVATIHASLGWDMITLEDIYYERIELLNHLLSAISKYFKGKASGILYQGEESKTINDFYTIGFLCDGIIEATPLTKKYHYLSNTSFNIKSNLNLEIIESKDKDELLYKSQKSIKTSDLIVLAKEDGTIIGGVHGEITSDRIDISLLVVIENFRGKKIGKKLMELIEEKATEKGVAYVALETCEFQAKQFYEKLGYRLVATLKDYPKGYEEYIFAKELNK